MTGVVRFAAGVVITGCPSPAQIRMLGAFDAVARSMGKDIIVTCGEEGHPPIDPHTLRKAFDIRVRDLDPPDQVELWKRLKVELGTRWTVLFESPILPDDPVVRDIVYVNPQASGPHIHCQPMKGTDYPPIPTQP